MSKNLFFLGVWFMKNKVLLFLLLFIIFVFITSCNAEEYSVDIEVKGDGVVGVSDYEEKYREGTEIKLVARPKEGYAFYGWSGDISRSQESISITVEDNLNIIAEFKKIYHLKTEVTNGEGKIVVSPEKDYYFEGEEVKVKAIPAEGWEFVSWGENLIFHNKYDVYVYGFNNIDTSVITVNEDIEKKAIFDTPVSFEDENLTKALHDIFKLEGNLYSYYFENVTILHIHDKGINNLSGLEQLDLSNIELLNLGNNNIKDLTPLSSCNLDSLKTLNLLGNGLSDLSPLAEFDFSNLKSLYLHKNNITSIGVLKDCDFSNLEELFLRNNDIKDILTLEEFHMPKIDNVYLGLNYCYDYEEEVDYLSEKGIPIS